MDIIKTKDGSPTFFSNRYNESFHSTFGAITEAKHVFLNASGVAERLRDGRTTNVLEIGFGLGLNALMTCDFAIQSEAELDFHSFENDRSICVLIQKINYAPYLRHSALATTLRAALQPLSHCSEAGYPPTKSDAESDSTKRLSAISLSKPMKIPFAPNVTLYLHWCDIVTNSLPDQIFDAVYLDAFSPDNNPECWTSEFLSTIRGVMNTNARLSTYCAKGSVRRALLAADFSVTKMPGPPGKREMMVATPNR